MFQSASRPAGELGDLVRNASHHQGPVAEIFGVARQRRSHGQPGQRQRDRQAVARRAWAAFGADVGGRPSTAIRTRCGGTRMAKPSSNPTPSPIWPMARRSGSADNDERYGAQGAFLIEAGISSSYHIANFFGLTEWMHRAQGDCDGGFEASASSFKEAAKMIPPVPAPVPCMADLATVMLAATTLIPGRRPSPAADARRSTSAPSSRARSPPQA